MISNDRNNGGPIPLPIVFLTLLRLTPLPFASSSLTPADFPPSQLNLLRFSSGPPACHFQPWHSSLQSLVKSKLSRSGPLCLPEIPNKNSRSDGLIPEQKPNTPVSATNKSSSFLDRLKIHTKVLIVLQH